MPQNKQVSVKDLHLDLSNYRTVSQPSEKRAIHAMIAISPDRFWALLESILDDGYHATENIIVQEVKGSYIVKEGNRRIAALKYALGFTRLADVPSHLLEKKKHLGEEWAAANTHVPCAVYKSDETQMVDKLIALTHAKGEKASRDGWTAVARARYARDEKKESAPGLDLLEMYLKKGKNLSDQQAERWAGDYSLTVLDEAIQKLTPLLGFKSSKDLVSSYPKKNKSILDRILFDIGTDNFGFKELRSAGFTKYGLTLTAASAVSGAGPASTQPPITTDGGTVPSSGTATKAKPASSSLNDPAAVKKALRNFVPRGNGRLKVVALRDELKKLKLQETPHAFCFVLRSLFELSAKAYCDDHKNSGGPSPIDKNGNDKKVVTLLGEIETHMTQHGKDLQKKKLLHGAMTELSKGTGVLSVTSMNQLVHNPRFSIQPSDICIFLATSFPCWKR